MRKNNVLALILAGGASSRLFPFNKLLSDLTGSGKTLIQQAYARAGVLTVKKNIYVLAVQDLVQPIKRQLRLPQNQFFMDPVRRGTWPALMWAMAHLRHTNPHAVLAVLTGDHVIPRLPAFKRAALQACRWAEEKSAMVMLGVSPGPKAAEWTGYGVFQVEGHTVTAFQEKPSLDQAERMRLEGGWSWNSGMFFFRIATAEEAMANYQSAMFAQYQALCAAVRARQMPKARALYADFPAKIPHPLDPSRTVDNTIDFAIMAPLVHVQSKLRALAICNGLPLWTDLGQWESLQDILKYDKAKNICLGTVQADRATNGCILAADRGFHLKVTGIKDAAIALSARGLLVLPRQELARIKERVAAVPAQKFHVVNTLPHVQIQQHGRRVVVTGSAFIG